MTSARVLPTPRSLRRLAVVATAALMMSVLPLAGDIAQADYEVTPYPGSPGSIVERAGDDLIPSYRYRGSNRFDTAHLIAEDTDTIQSENPEALATADTVVIARADLFPDALAGTFLAGLEGAPILLVSSSGPIEPHTQEALETIAPDNVILLGGTAAIGADVEDALDDDYEVERVSGSTRFGTAAAIAARGADALPDGPRTAIVASGQEFPDALVSGSVSYAAGLPLLLTPDEYLHPVVADALRDLAIDEVLLMGGAARLHEDVEDQIEALDIDVRRVFGRTRVGTAAALAALAVDRYGFSTTHVNFARGDAFPDALTLGPHAGEERAALLLTVDADRPDDGQSSNARFMSDSGCVRSLHIAGGVEAISSDAEQQLRTAATQPGLCFTLTPADSTNLIGEEHTVTATLTEDGLPIGGVVSFTAEPDVDSDAVPEPDAASELDLDENGQATFTFTSMTPGSVTITACAVVADSDEELCATASKTFNTDAFVESVSVDALMTHLEGLQACADQHGNRAAGGPGYDCSVDYIRDTLLAAGYDADAIEETFFDFVIWEEEAPGVLTLVDADETYRTDEEDSPIDYMTFSGRESGAPVSGVLAQPLGNVVPMDPNAPPSTSAAGCDPADFAGFPAGAIAVIQRGTCDFRVKAENAADAGAVGVIIFNEGQIGRQDLLLGTLSYVYSEREVPVFGTTYDFGADLVTNHLGETASIETDTFFQDEVGSNLILSIPGSDPQGAFMSGAHLDSVPEGAGINDNGSGSVGILEVALQLAEQGIQPRNDTYFAWWGAEEYGLIGSTCFVSGGCGRDLEVGRVVDLDALEYTELGEALLVGGYLNYDMIGSPNFMRGIYDGDGSEFGDVGPPGSDSIEATFENFFDRLGLPHKPSDFSGRSDYVEFTNYGIAAGGLFTGAEEEKTPDEVPLYGGVAGEWYDPCYHQACDNLNDGWTPPGTPAGPNINLEAFQTNAWAAANSALLYAMSLDSLTDPGGTGAFSAQALQRRPGPDTINGLAVR